MIILAALIFVADSLAIFHKNFCDGIVAKHMFAFSAIISSLVIVDPANMEAFVTAAFLMIGGVAYWAIKHYSKIKEKLHAALNY